MPVLILKGDAKIIIYTMLDVSCQHLGCKRQEQTLASEWIER